MTPPYLTILKWLHANEIRDYDVSRDMLATIMADEVLASASAANLLDAVSNDHGVDADVLAMSINVWARRNTGVLDVLPIGLRSNPDRTPTPSTPPMSAPPSPSSWTPLAKQFGRAIIGASVHGKRQLRSWSERVEGWMGDRAARAAVVALELAAHADGAVMPLVVTRETLLATLFDGDKNVPEWVKGG